VALGVAGAELSDARPEAFGVPRRLEEVDGLLERPVFAAETRNAVPFLETASRGIGGSALVPSPRRQTSVGQWIQAAR
jgi:hypothetical protein